MIELTMGERIKDLICAAGKTQKQVANESDIKEATLSEICNDVNKEFGYTNFIKLAKYFGVSIDYLLGLTDVKTPDIDTQAICKKTGLSEKAVERLSHRLIIRMTNINKCCDISGFISILIEEFDIVCIENNLGRIYYNDYLTENLISDISKAQSTQEFYALCDSFGVENPFNPAEKSELCALAISQTIAKSLAERNADIRKKFRDIFFAYHYGKYENDEESLKKLIMGDSDGTNS